MTDEERQQLCDWLRHLPAYLSEDGMQAAEEIERLAESGRFWKAEALKAGGLLRLRQGLKSSGLCKSAKWSGLCKSAIVL
jgi:hypothetical protein